MIHVWCPIYSQYLGKTIYCEKNDCTNCVCYKIIASCQVCHKDYRVIEGKECNCVNNDTEIPF